MATSITAAYSTRIIFFALLGQPRYPPSTPINENSPLLINPIKRLLLGSIFAGFLISNYIPLNSTPQITIPLYIKIAALGVTLIGFALALELSLITKHIKLNKPSKTHRFSNLLGYFPAIMHRIQPLLALKTSQKSASLLLDQI